MDACPADAGIQKTGEVEKMQHQIPASSRQRTGRARSLFRGNFVLRAILMTALALAAFTVANATPAPSVDAQTGSITCRLPGQSNFGDCGNSVPEGTTIRFDFDLKDAFFYPPHTSAGATETVTLIIDGPKRFWNGNVDRDIGNDQGAQASCLTGEGKCERRIQRNRFLANGHIKITLSSDSNDEESGDVHFSYSSQRRGSGVLAEITVIDDDANLQPSFSQTSYTRSILENSPAGSSVGAPVTATDPDGHDLVYSLQGTDANLFTIDSDTGQIQVGVGTALDYEIETSYTVIVHAEDVPSIGETPLSRDATVTIEVTDEQEDDTAQCKQPGASSFDDDCKSAVEGATIEMYFSIGNLMSPQTVGSLVMKAPKRFWNGNYHIQQFNDHSQDSQTGCESGGTGYCTVYFPVVAPGTAGTLTVRLNGDDIDEADGELSLGYNTITSNGTFFSLPIEDDDANQAPAAPASATREIRENSSAGSPVGDPVTATDPDGHPITYGLTGPDANSFDIDSATGQITVKAGHEPDYDVKSVHSVHVTATDSPTSGETALVSTTNVTIDVTDVVGDEAAMCKEPGSSSFRECSSTTEGATVKISYDLEPFFYCTRPTDPVCQGETIKLTIRAPKRFYNGNFQVQGGHSGGAIGNCATGSGDCVRELTRSRLTKSGSIQVNLAGDSTDEPDGQVVFGWAGQRGGGTLIRVPIDDDDANQPPTFALANYNLTVPENSTKGTDVGDPVVADDADGQEIFYSLKAVNSVWDDHRSFTVNAHTGQISVSERENLDYESDSLYVFLIRAADTPFEGDQAGSSTTQVSVNLTNVDDTSNALLISGKFEVGQRLDPDRSQLSHPCQSAVLGSSEARVRWRRYDSVSGGQATEVSSHKFYTLQEADVGKWIELFIDFGLSEAWLQCTSDLTSQRRLVGRPKNLSVSETSLSTDESGGTDQFDIVLDSQPTGTVTVTVRSDDDGEGVLSIGNGQAMGTITTTFTTGDWNVPQTVTATGWDDHIADGSATYDVTVKAIGGGYGAIRGPKTWATLSGVNYDDETPRLDVSESSVVTGEDGTTDSFDVTLGVRPLWMVNVTVASDNADEGAASPTSLTFLPDSFDVPQTVTVTGVDDDRKDGDVSYTITLTAQDGGYGIPGSAIEPITTASVAATNVDDDHNELSVSASRVITRETDKTHTAEDESQATFTVELAAQPAGVVTVTIAGDDPSEGTASPASLTFGTGDWDTPQTVTVTGSDDDVADGDIQYDILLQATGGGYGDVNQPTEATVIVTNEDDDHAGVIAAPANVATRETDDLDTASANENEATFAVTLDSQPTADVTVTVEAPQSALSEGALAAGGGAAGQSATLTFTPSNWNTPQTVTVTGVDDQVRDGPQSYSIGLAAADAGEQSSGYAGVTASVSVTNEDDEPDEAHAGIVVTYRGQGAGQRVVTDESGTVHTTFTVALSAQPSESVRIDVLSEDESEGAVSPSSLTFELGDWDQPQLVTVTGVDDDVDDGEVSYNITLTVEGMSPTIVQATNEDDDTRGIAIVESGGDTVTTEAGPGDDTFTVALASEPTGDITVSVASGDTSEGTVEPASLTFSADKDQSNGWNTPQMVTVTGVGDDVDDGDANYDITLSASGGDYGTVTAIVQVINENDDALGIVFSKTQVNTTEAGGADSFMASLLSRPTSNVTVEVMSDDESEATASPSSLTFTSDDYDTPQTVTVTGVDDDSDDGDVEFSIVLSATGGGYGRADLSEETMDAVAGVNEDDDTNAILVNRLRLFTNEAGGSAIFRVSLTASPDGPVTVSVTSGDPTEGKVSPESLTFGPSNYALPQTVTVTGVDDPDLDGDVDYVITLSATGGGYGADGIPVTLDIIVTNQDDIPEVSPSSPLPGSQAPGAIGGDQITVESLPRSIIVFWTAPDDTGGVHPEYLTYEVQYDFEDKNLPSSWTLVDAGGNWMYFITGLQSGSEYVVQVRAVNDAGAGPWSEPILGRPN